VAQTDAEAATLLDSANMDGRDHPFLMGVNVPGVEALLQVAMDADLSGNVNAVTQNGLTWAKLMMTVWQCSSGFYGGSSSYNTNSSHMLHNQPVEGDQQPLHLSNAKAQPVADSVTKALFTLIVNFAVSKKKATTKSSRRSSIGLQHQTSKSICSACRSHLDQDLSSRHSRI